MLPSSQTSTSPLPTATKQAQMSAKGDDRRGVERAVQSCRFEMAFSMFFPFSRSQWIDVAIDVVAMGLVALHLSSAVDV
jgi:hypothetical protein